MTSSIEIEKALQPLGFYFGGVFSKDELPSTINGKIYVVNLGNMDTGGTHWTLVSDFGPDECVYYDSYGLSAPDEIRKFMSTCHFKKKLKYSDMQHQHLESDWCGEFCVFVALKIFNHVKFLTIVEQLLTPNIARNEKIVAGYIDRD